MKVTLNKTVDGINQNLFPVVSTKEKKSRRKKRKGEDEGREEEGRKER